MSEADAERIVYKVVLTGGPCAGKTTALDRIKAHFEAQHWMVLTVPEVATIIFKTGLCYNASNRHQSLGLIENFVKAIIQLENTFVEFAEADASNRNVLVVCDRGAMDPSAFCSAEEWTTILTKNGWDMVQLRDARYDHVIHMVSAASGAELSYQTTPFRTEEPHLARERDAAATKAWLGHPCHDVLDNSTGFEDKLHRVIRSISTRIGGNHLCARHQVTFGVHLLKSRAFLLTSMPDDNKFHHYRDFDVQHDFQPDLAHDLLTDPTHGFRLGHWTILCKRGETGQSSHLYTSLKRVPHQLATISRRISSHQYHVLVKQLEGHAHHPSVQWRERHFLHNGHVAIVIYQQQDFKSPAPTTAILRIREDLDVPTFLTVSHDVTDDPAYSPYSLCDVAP